MIENYKDLKVWQKSYELCLTILKKVVTPADPGSSPGGVQVNHKFLKTLDSGFRRNDGKWHFLTFYEFILFRYIQNSKIPKGRKIRSNFTDKKIGCICSFP